MLLGQQAKKCGWSKKSKTQMCSLMPRSQSDLKQINYIFLLGLFWVHVFFPFVSSFLPFVRTASHSRLKDGPLLLTGGGRLTPLLDECPYLD